MKSSEQRLNNIIGQLAGIKKILNDDQRGCFSALTQLKAVRSATAAVMNKILEDEFNRCLIGSSQSEKEKINKIFKEIIKK